MNGKYYCMIVILTIYLTSSLDYFIFIQIFDIEVFWNMKLSN